MPAGKYCRSMGCNNHHHNHITKSQPQQQWNRCFDSADLSATRTSPGSEIPGNRNGRRRSGGPLGKRCRWWVEARNTVWYEKWDGSTRSRSTHSREEIVWIYWRLRKKDTTEPLWLTLKPWLTYSTPQQWDDGSVSANSDIVGSIWKNQSRWKREWGRFSKMYRFASTPSLLLRKSQPVGKYRSRGGGPVVHSVTYNGILLYGSGPWSGSGSRSGCGFVQVFKCTS